MKQGDVRLYWQTYEDTMTDDYYTLDMPIQLDDHVLTDNETNESTLESQEEKNDDAVAPKHVILGSIIMVVINDGLAT
jgi:hypothetical protein